MFFMIARLILIGSAGLVLGFGSCTPARRPAPQQESRPAPALTASLPPPANPHWVDFNTQVRPLLEDRCQPCHFTGGKMYERLPFDRPETIRSLGEKMFTRIRDEHEQALLRSFLAQDSEPRSR
jgi:hypothetical protein